MTKRIETLEEKIAVIEARMKSHWALQTDEEFADSYIVKIRNELHSSILKMAIGAIVLLAGSGFVFIKYAVNEQFNSQNEKLKQRLERSYSAEVEKTYNNFEWRRFHDYGKDYVNLAELYSKSPIEVEKKRQEVKKHLNEAEKYFRDALSHGDMHASTYWELGELYYTYRLDMGLMHEVDKVKAVQKYMDAANRYTEVEVSKGWRAEVYYRIGLVYWDLTDDSAISDQQRSGYIKQAKHYLELAKNEYSRFSHLTDDRSKDNIEGISDLLGKIETTG